MARPRTAMRDIREVLRLSYEAGLTHRQIAESLRLAATTVRRYLARAEQAGLARLFVVALLGQLGQRLVARFQAGVALEAGQRGGAALGRHVVLQQGEQALERGLAVLIVTHDSAPLAHAAVHLHLADGRLSPLMPEAAR